MDREKVKELATTYAERHKSDVLLCSGPMNFGLVDAIHACLDRTRHDDLLLILTTTGGDAHEAYRMARILQRTYVRVRVFVSGWCKSAGTLLAVCGHELIIGDRGELGPVDIQRGRTDDLWESTSGLTETAAIRTLEEVSWRLYRMLVTETKALSNGQITFKAAADAAVPLVSGMLEPIFGQIDPLKLGENARALDIASQYAQRLNEHSRNLNTANMNADALISDYPDHGFVIDRKEAKRLFHHVSKPSDELRAIGAALGKMAVYPPEGEYPVLAFLNPEPTTQEESNDNQDAQVLKIDGASRSKSADSAAVGADAPNENDG